jgi:hypothetical protein
MQVAASRVDLRLPEISVPPLCCLRLLLEDALIILLLVSAEVTGVFTAVTVTGPATTATVAATTDTFL